MYSFKLENLSLLGQEEEISLSPITVVVGPNNAGKSRFLRDVASLITNDDNERVVVTKLTHSYPSSVDEFIDSYNPWIVQQQGNDSFKTLQASGLEQVTYGLGGDWRQQSSQALRTPNFHHFFDRTFGHHFVRYLSTETRLRLAAESPTLNVHENVQNLMQSLYKSGSSVQKRLSTYVESVFGQALKLDYSALENLCLRVGKDFSQVPPDLSDAWSILSSYPKLDEQGDGLRSFVGLSLALMVDDRPVTLIDEPEAFLHPPQAIRVGEMIGELGNDRQIIVATHSADLLRGLLNTGLDILIIRLTRTTEGGGIYTVLDPQDLENIFKSPLLTSSRVIDGLFYSGSVVVEADADRAFYQRVARQVRQNDDVHYVHAHNKQTLQKVIGPYRSLNISCAAVVDFDILRVTQEFQNLLASLTSDPLNDVIGLQKQIRHRIMGISSEYILNELFENLGKLLAENENTPSDADAKLSYIRRTLQNLRKDADKWREVKKKGKYALDEDGQILFEKLDSWCRSRGLFIVPVGELESLLNSHDILRADKQKWIVEALTRLTSLEVNVDQLPWSFVKDIHDYLLSN